MSRAFCSHAPGSFGAFASVDGGGDEIGCDGVWAVAAVETQASSSATQRMVRLPPKVGGGTLRFLRAASSGEVAAHEAPGAIRLAKSRSALMASGLRGARIPPTSMVRASH